MRDIPKKSMRLQEILDLLQKLPPARSWGEAYVQISSAIRSIEDKYFGEDSYSPPTSLPDVTNIPRMYAPHPESIYTVPMYTKVNILISTHHVTFLSKHGAIEIQYKINHDRFGYSVPFYKRNTSIIVKKDDAYGHGVWHSKNL